MAQGRNPRRVSIPTFAQASETVIAIHAENWKDRGKSEHQWRASLRDYALPHLGGKRINAISTADVMAVLCRSGRRSGRPRAASDNASGRS